MPNTLIKSKWSSGNFIFYPTTDDTGVINIGDGTFDCDFKIFVGSTTEYFEFDVGNSRLNAAAPIVYSAAGNKIGTSTTDGLTLSEDPTEAWGVYGDVAADATAATVVRNTYNHLYMASAQTNDWDWYGAVGHVTVISNTADGNHAGVWGQYQFSGTSAVTETSESLQAGVIAEIKSDNNLSLGTGAVAAGLIVDGAIGSSATVNGDTDGIHIKKQSATLDFEHGITITDCISAGILHFPDGSSGTIVSDSSDVAAATSNGYIAIRVGSNTRYLKFWDSAS